MSNYNTVEFDSQVISNMKHKEYAPSQNTFVYEKQRPP